MIKQFLILTLISLSLPFYAQDSHELYEEYSHILIQNQNDFWNWRSRTDRYFTNSIYVEHISNKYSERWKGHWLLNLFPKLEYNDSVHNFGFGFGQDFYTPIDISIKEIQSEDRPYAGFLYLSFKNVSNSYFRKSRLNSTYTLGIIGPLSFSEEIQKTVHTIQGSNIPKGWNNQIANDLGINLNINFEKRILRPNEFIDFIGFLDANVFSTVSNNLSTGLHYRVGLFNDYFTNITAMRPSNDKIALLNENGCSYYCDAIKRTWQFYGYIKTNLTSILDNSFLQGGLINRSSSHTFHTDDIFRFYFQGEFGLRFNTQGIDVIYAQLFRTPEFSGAKNSYWGKIQFIFSY